MANNYHKLSDADFNGFLKNFKGVADSEGATYGWDATEQADIVGKSDAFDAALEALTAAEATYRAAVQTKEDTRQAAEAMVTQYGQPLYFNPAISDAEIAQLGLEPRSGSRAPVIPQIPLTFVANALSDGRVNFTWNRNANPYSVSFAIEVADYNGTVWAPLITTSKSKITVSGFTPGIAKKFRIAAFKGDDYSAFSNIATIYAAGGDSALRVA